VHAEASVTPLAQAQTANSAYTNVVDARVIGDPNSKGVLYEVTAAGTIPKRLIHTSTASFSLDMGGMATLISLMELATLTNAQLLS
jgi:hypothetical protein